MIFKLISELCKSIAVMNSDGMRVLVSTAKDITGHDKYRKRDGDLTPEQFTRQVNQVIRMVDRGYRKELSA